MSTRSKVGLSFSALIIVAALGIVIALTVLTKDNEFMAGIVIGGSNDQIATDGKANRTGVMLYVTEGARLNTTQGLDVSAGAQTLNACDRVVIKCDCPWGDCNKNRIYDESCDVWEVITKYAGPHETCQNYLLEQGLVSLEP